MDGYLTQLLTIPGYPLPGLPDCVVGTAMLALNLANAGFGRFGELASAASLVLVVIGCVLLHVRLRKPASLSLVMALAATTLWGAAGQSMVHDLLMPPAVSSLPAGTSGINAQTAIDTLDRAAPAYNAMIVVDSILVLWMALSFVLAVASIARTHRVARPDDGMPLPDARRE